MWSRRSVSFQEASCLPWLGREGVRWNNLAADVFLASSQMERVALMAGVRVSLEKGEGREAILLIEGFPQGCRRARGIIQVVVIDSL